MDIHLLPMIWEPVFICPNMPRRLIDRQTQDLNSKSIFKVKIEMKKSIFRVKNEIKTRLKRDSPPLPPLLLSSPPNPPPLPPSPSAPLLSPPHTPSPAPLPLSLPISLFFFLLPFTPVL